MTITTEQINTLLHDEILARLIPSLNQDNALIKELLKMLLSSKVKDPNHSYREITFIECVLQESFKNIISSSVKEWVKERAEEIKKTVFDELNSNKNSLASAFTESLLKSLKTDFSVHTSIKLMEKRGDYE